MERDQDEAGDEQSVQFEHTESADSPLVRALSRFYPLTPAAHRGLDQVPVEHVTCTRGADVCPQSTRAGAIPVVTAGWACQYRLLNDGRRFVLGFFLPGDVVNGVFPLLDRESYDIMAASEASVALYSAQDLLAVLRGHPTVALAFLVMENFNHGMLRNRALALARLTAYERLGWFYLEMLERQRVIGLVEENSFRMPVRQSLVGEYLGVHDVHLSRTVRRLTEDGMIRREGEMVTVPEPETLASRVEYPVDSQSGVEMLARGLTL